MRYKIIFYFTYFLFLGCLKETKTVFDIPSLIGKNINEVRYELNQFVTDSSEPVNSTEKEWDSIFKKEGIILHVFYDTQTKKILRFHLISEKEAFSDLKDLLKLGNLDPNSGAYILETDNSFDLGRYRTVRVILK
jgi:hypothetical protein